MGHCENSVVIDAPADKVWSTIRNFHDLSWAPGVVTSVDAVGTTPGDQVGARRILNGAFHETLVALDDEGRRVQYTIDDGPGPVARDAVRQYNGFVDVMPVTADGRTFVRWTSSYESADERAVGDLCNPIYQALLAALKAHMEQ